MRLRIRILSLTAVLLIVLGLTAANAEPRSSVLESDGKVYKLDPPLSSNPWELEDFYVVEYNEALEGMLYSNLELYNNEDSIISQQGGLTIHYETGRGDEVTVQETSLLMSSFGRMVVNRWGDGEFEVYVCPSGGVITGPEGYEFDEALAGMMDIDYLWDNYMFPWAGGYTYIFGVREGDDGISYYYMLNSDMMLFEYVACMNYELLEIRRYVADESGESCVYDGRVWFTGGEIDIPEEVSALLSENIPT